MANLLIEATRDTTFAIVHNGKPIKARMMADAITEVPEEIWAKAGERKDPNEPSGREILEREGWLIVHTAKSAQARANQIGKAFLRPFAPAQSAMPPAPVADSTKVDKASQGKAAFDAKQ
jgi:lambda repressor-like predicted transcriptional regulator